MNSYVRIFKIIATSVAVGSVLLYAMGCECVGSDESVRMLVFQGERTDCAALMKEHSWSAQSITYICPGEKVTICWTSSAVQSLTLKIGSQSESVAASGSKVVTINDDTDIVLEPVGAKCASASKFKVEVVSGPTPSHWDARWTNQCGKMSFTISDVFLSPTIRARDIRATWVPSITVNDEKGQYTVPCKTPPFLLGEHMEEAFGFEVKEPFVSVSFSRPLKAVGHWNFVWRADCSPHRVDICNTTAVFPFDVTLDCP